MSEPKHRPYLVEHSADKLISTVTGVHGHNELQTAIFVGTCARDAAEEYAAWKNAPRLTEFVRRTIAAQDEPAPSIPLTLDRIIRDVERTCKDVDDFIAAHEDPGYAEFLVDAAFIDAMRDAVGDPR